MEPTNEPQKSGEYKKLSKKQWWVIYIVVGAVVYGLIYWFFIKGDGTGIY